MEYLPHSTHEVFIAIISIITGYILGSIPFGLLLTQISGIEDIRHIGSGNIGATNVLRTGNKKLAFMTLICDAIKAVVAIIIISILFNNKAGELAGFATFIGHIFPVWLKFKGGKGISTYIGILISLKPSMIIFFAIIWILCFLITRYSSISSLLSTSLITITFWVILPETNLPIIFTLMMIIIYWTHLDNIKRLISGSETKIILTESDNGKN
ncbi:MAG: glycerol-3-phosphate 1-O-acyltransferase [Candidatus Liberibacter ctenarytainae]|uniref:Glycerol-3-phosphate acyltransferase n=1 Tax=Candidatus Liberibacter ctenarytainae TaxID=2020335 RepID=A0A937DGJ3_9HYPH|nr:glycerol-3-phosphate 1-O-acyltransferase [Candidatus Liberibacter ctenarytainae]